MILKRVEELNGNEVLGRDVVTFDYQIILSKGTNLKKSYLDKLIELGILEVWIQEKEEVPIKEVEELRFGIEGSIKAKVKDILERHTYHQNKELEKLSYAADNIISSILEEEKVVEKVYDINQRTPDIYEHSVNICSLAILTALKMDLDKEVIHDIGVSCLLHDIGLRYVTMDFNNRELSEFQENELTQYKKHPVYGFTALNDEPWISQVSKNIILGHHECLDGSGFPLRVTDIPIENRIVCICDTFDEMICGIACKRSKVYEAIEYLKVFKNKKFDGNIVDAFLGFIAVYPAGTRVLTNEGEIGVVLSQNKNFQDRPVIRIVKDSNGNLVKEEVIKNLIKVNNIYIEKSLD